MNTSMRFFIPVISFLLLFSWSQKSLCQSQIDTSQPITIEADRMETSKEQASVLFTGNVQATQGNLVINADEMTVLYTRAAVKPEGSSAERQGPLTQKIEKIIARGNVKVVQEDWVAAGDTMDFNAGERIVILAGNAKAWQDKNMVSGEKIVLYLNEGKSVVEKSEEEDGRVRAFIYPSSEEKTNSR